MAAIMVFHATHDSKIELHVLNDADKIVAYPNYEGIEKIPAEGLDSVFSPNIKWAIDNNALPNKTAIPTTLLMLKSILFGVPLFVKEVSYKTVRKYYREQLNILWGGIIKHYKIKGEFNE